MRLFERLDIGNLTGDAARTVNGLFDKLPLGAFCLYKTWLLLLEVFEFENFFDSRESFAFRMGRKASLQAIASRHWYKTACSFSAQVYAAEVIHDAIVPISLPGFFSMRGDWFLGSPKTSRSRLLAQHAFDLLCSRRANLTRLQRGLGLPVRDILADSRECGSLRTALRCRLEEQEVESPGTKEAAKKAQRKSGVVSSTQISYEHLARLGSSEDWHNPVQHRRDFRWLWRHRIRDYDRQSRVFQKWTARVFRWTIELRERLAGDWQGGFLAYDHLTCRHFAEVSQYPSFAEFAEHCDLLLAELRASAPGRRSQKPVDK